eukprot:GFKZ01012276.1.p1 GENE.GFKZ01012276.1~~GFKZ01012276.1.p1  ORF type:complete len:235 (-),score=7.92 GFKZ01012276.1:81-785(-)
MHKEVDQTLTAERRAVVDRHNRKTHVHSYNPTRGGYVVVARMHCPSTKVSANCVGPRRVSNILSEYVVEVEHLLSGKRETVHVCRIKHYRDADVGANVTMEKITEFSDRVWHSVDTIKDLRAQSNYFEVLVSWKGLTAHGDSWEPLGVMFEDVPSKDPDFFSKRRETALIKRAKVYPRLQAPWRDCHDLNTKGTTIQDLPITWTADSTQIIHALYPFGHLSTQVRITGWHPPTP